MDLQANPFAALSFIAAPAVLTNSSSVLILSTSNRLARAVDLGRSLIAEMDRTAADGGPVAEVQSRELAAVQRRMIILIQALRAFYVALGCFAGATLVSLLGAALAQSEWSVSRHAVEVIAVGAGVAAVSALVRGSVLLLRETRIAVRVLHERAQRTRARFAAGKPPALGEPQHW